MGRVAALEVVDREELVNTLTGNYRGVPVVAAPP
jgi:hypothetical protein